ncbi:primosomal protein N' [Xylella fastidiosa]|uniref:Replication restart protein PriA n=1 Tax=Xylella fastidiosa (strain 9a5c) TaxID=160492 RepID=Q9PA31_XYLFA|nr:primosomal protein N' [Xylella fastidiosa]AAF85486.1 primosomal protein N' [Xylella fastidiosa 9a5c]ALQ95684.1 primosome assembly protein PriA [Xylella fastidiosa]ALQ97991.1 primosomal protein N' [Xylella fastidiosa]ALR02871.1 primosome assembly protein PriA [Xylella fastidiosa]ALR05149.1 primosomal protein N' [Xylella fastidiosa]
MPPTILRVALPIPLPQCFDYLPPSGIPLPDSTLGCRVRVPFGKRELIGVVVELPSAEMSVPLREAFAWIDRIPILDGELAQSLQWLSHYTHTPLGEILATALPGLLRHGKPLPETWTCWAWRLTETGRTAAPKLRRNSRSAQLAELLTTSDQTEDALNTRMNHWRTVARNLTKRGYVERIKKPTTVSLIIQTTSNTVPVLNTEQQKAVETLNANVGFKTYLLDGVTGSGKTEVYLQAIATCLAASKQALVLVPEIGLTPQLLTNFHARLGIPVHALHSKLADNERARVWAAARCGEARLVLGTRSAVFTPLPHAGLIIVDEEHDTSYKQQDGIRYNARDFALVRGKALNVPVILGSATPSLESLYNAHNGRYKHLRLTYRAGQAYAPQVRVLDVRKRPLKDGLSPEVLTGINATLARDEQVLVFKNRRGYSPVLLCHDCGWTATCQQCSTSVHRTPMTVYTGGTYLQCHHCDARQPMPLSCPDCGSTALQPQGIGTERLEARLIEAFPKHPVVRIDRNTTQHRDALKTQFTELGNAAGILVGTQILAKGHHLPRLTMVVVVGIDEGLFSADFRATEKLSQQLIQVAGRAGRAKHAGEVWLQTHHPDHPLLQTLINGGYHTFANTELQQRQAAGLPPFAHLALLRAEAKDTTSTQQFLATVRKHIPIDNAVECYGPMSAPMPRRAGYERYQLLLSSSQRNTLHRTLNVLIPAIHALPEARRVRWSLDVDPVDLY